MALWGWITGIEWVWCLTLYYSECGIIILKKQALYLSDMKPSNKKKNYNTFGGIIKFVDILS